MATEQLTEKGNRYEAVEYVDPMPGHKGDEVVWETCGKCGGDGVVHYGRVFIQTRAGEDRWCFWCHGKGQTSRKVSSIRAAARREVKAANFAAAAAADWKAQREEREAAEAAAKAEEEAREAARLAAKPKGFIAEVGAKVEFAATVATVRYFDSYDHFGRPARKAILKFADGNGHVGVWFTDWSHDLEEGQSVTVRGTVKGHDEYDGEEQTVLTRCKVQ